MVYSSLSTAKKIEEDIQNGLNLSPKFDSMKSALSYLKKKARKDVITASFDVSTKEGKMACIKDFKSIIK